MSKQQTEVKPNDRRNLAVYWDFENIHISIKQLSKEHKSKRYKDEPKVMDVDAIMDFIASYGDVSINKAYCDWTNYSSYKEVLLNHSVDLFQLYHMNNSGKNGADIRMSIDLLEDLNTYPHLTDFVIIGSDVDYVGVAQKVRQKGKRIIGIGIITSGTNPFYVKACNEFYYYQTILNKLDTSDEEKKEEAIDLERIEKSKALLFKVINQLLRMHDSTFTYKSAIKPMMRRIDPTFDEGNFGCKSFSTYLEHFATDLEMDEHKVTPKRRLRY